MSQAGGLAWQWRQKEPTGVGIGIGWITAVPECELGNKCSRRINELLASYERTRRRLAKNIDEGT